MRGETARAHAAAIGDPAATTSTRRRASRRADAQSRQLPPVANVRRLLDRALRRQSGVNSTRHDAGAPERDVANFAWYLISPGGLLVGLVVGVFWLLRQPQSRHVRR